MSTLGEIHLAPARWRWLAAAILALACAGLLFGLLIVPAPAASATANEPAAVAFSLDRQWVSLPGQCTTLRWDVSGVAELYINGAGQVGQGTREICPTWPVTFTLAVVLPDGARQTYPLLLDVAIWMPGFWLLLGGALLAGGTALHLTGRLSTPPVLVRAATWLRARPWAGSLLYGAVVLWIVVVLFVYWATNEAPGLADLLALAEWLQSTLRPVFTAPYLG